MQRVHNSANGCLVEITQGSKDNLELQRKKSIYYIEEQVHSTTKPQHPKNI